MFSARVTEVESFRIWKGDEDLDLGWILSRLRDRVESEAMRVGTAFHKALELGSVGDYDMLSGDGYLFHVNADITLELPTIREVRTGKQYGDLTVSGQVDAIDGRIIYDHKTTKQFDADRYMESYQWRYYLDLFDADAFRYNVFVLKETDDPKVYVVSDFHRLEQRRYPDLHADCERLAGQFAEFAREHLTVVQ
jgi:hypothetical protein